MKFCPRCKIEYAPELRFCSNCGTPLVELAAEAGEPAQPENGVPESAAEAAESAAEAPEESAAEPEEAEPIRQTYHVQTQSETPAQTGAVPPAHRGRPPRTRRKVRVWRRILACFLCLFLFVFLLATALLFSFRRTTEERDGLEAILEDVTVADLPASDFFSGVDDGTLTVAQALGRESGEDAALFEHLLDNEDFKAFVAKQAASLMSDIYNGRTRYKFSMTDLEKELTRGRLNRALADEGYPIPDEDIHMLVEYLRAQGLDETISTRSFKSEAPEAYKTLNYVFGVPSFVAQLILILALGLLILAVNRGRIDLWLGDVGGTALTVGLILSLFTAFTNYLPDVWQDICGGKAVISLPLAAFCRHNVKLFLILFAAGLLTAVLGRLLRGRGTIGESA